MFLAYETKPRVYMQGAVPLAGFRLVTLCPIRQGEITFGFNIGYSAVAAQWLAEQIYDKKGEYGSAQKRFRFRPDACGVSEWCYLPPAFYAPQSWLALAPIEWVDTEPPLPMWGFIGFSRMLQEVPTANILGGAPAISLDIGEVPTLARPGMDVSFPIGLGLGESGGSGSLNLMNTLKDIALNPRELAKVNGDFTMPALLPGQVHSFSLASEIKLCDVTKLFDTKEAANIIQQKLAALGFPKKSAKGFIVNPTDCILADIKNGRIDILGQDIDYSGYIWTEGGIPQPISGKAPASLTYTGKLQYLRIQPTRDLAICENGSLLSKASRIYEYSNLPFPLPIKLGQRVFTTFDLLLPASDLKPRFMSKSRVSVREIVHAES